ncbi:sulfur transferase domain-containing protein [Niveispirillum sp.]|uniref:fused DSP-PTPase phosphatase/NAD kinase-like protein n=1 Tax=Niveispirillum sp. TaxID=1917217 RepID=UPI001B478253|nr:sulfur transferase domain-containing protein [Niveispirillum sp.]MBP7340317.1 tyrosine-protein phosphatase [Niveispirillum sp.]
MQYEETRLRHAVVGVPEWAQSDCWRVLTRRYADTLFNDHAFIRMAYRNFHCIGPDMYRSSQPTPGQIDDLARMGIRTIINLRGRRPTCGSYFFEVRACARLGIELVDFPVRSRDVPRKEDLFAARELFRRLEGPTVMHCKAGADRVGLMSVLYQFVGLGLPLEQAMEQLSWKYGHLRQSKTGILDHFFESFLATGGRSVDEFYQWVATMYDPAAMKAGFLSRRWANVVTDRLLQRE